MITIFLARLLVLIQIQYIFTIIFTCDMPQLQDCCRIVLKRLQFCTRIVARLFLLTQIQYISNIYSYFHMCYASVAGLLQDCSRIIAILLQDYCKNIAGLFLDLQDYCRIVP